MKHVPDIRLNLISVRKLDADDYCNTFVNRLGKLTKASLIVAKGTRSSSLYVLHAKIYNHVVNIAEKVDISKLSHKRLCHANKKGLNLLGKKTLLNNDL